MITKNELKRFQSFMGFEEREEKKVEDKPKVRHKAVSKKRTRNRRSKTN